MARPKKYKVFVSYSRHDEALVKPLAGMLGVAANDAVFLDVTSIQPGALWEQEIIGAIKQSSVFVLCWCCECEHSTFIAREISTALEQGNKRMVPVLFCATPLPPTMADRQWINLTGQVVHHCTHAHQPPADTAPPAPAPAAATPPASSPHPEDTFNFNIPSPTRLVTTACLPSAAPFAQRDPPPRTQGAPPPLPRSSRPKITVAVGALILIALITSLLIKFGSHIRPSVWITIGIAVVLSALNAYFSKARNSSQTVIATRYTPPLDEDQIENRARNYFQNLGKK